MSSAKGTSVEANVEKIEEQLRTGEYYEAHQRVRIIVARLQKQGLYDEAIEVAGRGAVKLNEYKQCGSAVDVGTMMLTMYIARKVRSTKESRERVLKIMSGFPPKDPSKPAFLDALFRWIQTLGKEPNPELRHAMGVSFWENGDFERARAHFLSGDEGSAEVMGRMLFAVSTDENRKVDRELLIAEAVLLYMARSNLREANTLFATYSALWYSKDPTLVAQTEEILLPSAFTPPGTDRSKMNLNIVRVALSTLPLFNFCLLLPMTVQRNSPQLFITLRDHYTPLLKKNPQLPQLLDTVSEGFYNVMPASAPQGDLLSSLFGSMFQGAPLAQPPTPSSNKNPNSAPDVD